MHLVLKLYWHRMTFWLCLLYWKLCSLLQLLYKIAVFFLSTLLLLFLSQALTELMGPEVTHSCLALLICWALQPISLLSLLQFRFPLRWKVIKGRHSMHKLQPDSKSTDSRSSILGSTIRQRLSRMSMIVQLTCFVSKVIITPITGRRRIEVLQSLL